MNYADSLAENTEYLVFNLGLEEHGLDILKVQEIRGYEKVTAIANTPAYIKGVIDLRGTIVTIIDLRIKFSLGVPSYDQFTVVIILNMDGRTLGIVVDGVSDVVTLRRQDIKPAPEFGTSLNTDFILGFGSTEARTVILVDMEKMLVSQQLQLSDYALTHT